MRCRYLLLPLALVLAACPSSDMAMSAGTIDGVSVVPEYANSSASVFDAAGVGGAKFPDGLNLTTEQKAAIGALHDAFRTATAADVALLRAIEAEARAAKQAGKSNDEIHAILGRAAPIRARMDAAFAALQIAVNALYTAEQRAWIAAHQPRPCGPDGPPRLTDAQMQQTRALQAAFMNAVKDDIAAIRQIAESARAAATGGATRDAVNAILRQADAARARVRAAEVTLHTSLDAVLTPEQRAARCQPQRQGPQPPITPHG